MDSEPVILFPSTRMKPKGKKIGAQNELTSSNETCEEHGEAVVAVSAEGQNNADQHEDKACDHALPCQGNGAAIVQ